MRTIYVDVLLILNLYVNRLLLHAAARLTHTRLSGIRSIIAAAAGSLTSLLVLLPAMPLVPTLCIKLLSAAVPVGAAFGIRRFREFLLKLLVFMGVSFVFAGFMLAVCSASGRDILIWSGSCIYLHFSLTALILCTAAAYFLLRIFSWARLRFTASSGEYEVIIRVGTHTAVMKGLADTGNSLTDCFTGKSVIVFDRNTLSAIPETASPEKLHGYRLIPYETVSGSGLMPVFVPDEIVIRSADGRISKQTDSLAGLSDNAQEYAIFSPVLLHAM